MAKIQDIRNRTPKRSSKRNLKSVTHIARHHSATEQGNFDSFWSNRWKGLGWITGGYHEIILRDGTVQLCYDADMVTNGVGDHNSYTYHICLVGNGSFTPAQEKAWEERCLLAMQRLNIPVNRVLGHNEFKGTATNCPGIDMSKVRTRLIEVQKGVGSVANRTDAKVVYEGKPVKGFVEDGRTYVQVRDLANLTGLKVGWDQGSKTVTLSK